MRHVVKLLDRTCTCEEWQHTDKPCEHALAFPTTQKQVPFNDYVHEYFSVQRFIAAYERVIEPMTDRSMWPKVDLGYVLGAPLGKRGVGRHRKNRIKSFLEGGSRKGKVGKDNENEKEKEKDIEKGKEKIMIRGPVTCRRCGNKDHRQASYKCPLNGTKKKPRKPRKNKTKQLRTDSTPMKSNITKGPLLEDSPGMLTRR